MSRVDTRVSPPSRDAVDPPTKNPPRHSAAPARTQKRHKSDVVRAFLLLRRHRGGTAPYVLTFIMLCFEALTAVLEPVPIAYTVDFVSGEVPSLRDRGFPAFMANEQWARRGLHRASGSRARLQHPGHDVRPAPEAVDGLPRQAPHR